MTEKINALVLCASPASTPQLKIECSRNVANDVLVAMPDTPEIDTCPPRVPSTKSKLRNTGWPSRPMPTGTFEPAIVSKYSAESRSAPVARYTGCRAAAARTPRARPG